MRHRGVYGANRFFTRQRLTQDTAEKRGRCTIGLARAHTDRHQAGAAAIDKAFTAVVGHHVLAHQLLCAIRGLRRGEGIVRHHIGQGVCGIGSVDRHRTAEQQTGFVTCRTQCVQQSTGAVQVRSHTQIEIGFALTRYR